MNEIDFRAERNEALLSMDEAKIRAFYRKWNESDGPKDIEVFRAAVHKAITGNKDLPVEIRRASRTWLEDRKLKSFDDGDL